MKDSINNRYNVAYNNLKRLKGYFVFSKNAIHGRFSCSARSICKIWDAREKSEIQAYMECTFVSNVLFFAIQVLCNCARLFEAPQEVCFDSTSLAYLTSCCLPPAHITVNLLGAMGGAVASLLVIHSDIKNVFRECLGRNNSVDVKKRSLDYILSKNGALYEVIYCWSACTILVGNVLMGKNNWLSVCCIVGFITLRYNHEDIIMSELEKLGLDPHHLK